MPDPDPKLRVVDESEIEVVRLKGDAVPDGRATPVLQPEVAERLEAGGKRGIGGRSIEPDIDSILEPEDPTETLENAWDGEDKRVGGIPHGWFWLIGLLIVGAGVWSVMEMRKGEKQLDLQIADVQEQVADDAEETQLAMDLVDRVEEVVAAYLAADSMDGILPWIRHPERVRPLLEAEWRKRPKAPLDFVRMPGFQPITLGGKPFWVVKAAVAGGGTETLFLEQTGDSEVKVDWEMHVCRQPMDWDDYVARRPGGTVMDFRVWAVPDSYYSHEFSDSGRWRCYRLTAKGSDQPLFGYLEAGSDEEKMLTEYCYREPGRRAPAILRLKLPEGTTSPKGVLIEKQVEPRWLYVDDPSKNSP